MLSDQELDGLIKKCIRREIEEQAVPPKAKERVKKALGLDKSNNFWSKYRLVASIAAALALMLILNYAVFPGSLYQKNPGVKQGEKTTLAEAKVRLPFALWVPKYLPKDLELEEVRIAGEESNMQVILVFSGEKRSLVIKEMGISMNDDTVVFYDSGEGTEEKIVLNGVEAALFISERGWHVLEWKKQGVNYRLEGSYTKEEFIKIAESFFN